MWDNRGPKERAYDEKINPLMAQIIALAKEHKINMFATFSLDYPEGSEVPLTCNTGIAKPEHGDEVGSRRVAECARIVLGRSDVALTTIITKRPVPTPE